MPIVPQAQALSHPVIHAQAPSPQQPLQAIPASQPLSIPTTSEIVATPLSQGEPSYLPGATDIVPDVLAMELQTVQDSMRSVSRRLEKMEEENRFLRWQVKTLGGSPLQVVPSAVAKRQCILSKLPFLIGYGLLSPTVPFAITDIEYHPRISYQRK